jgi:twitching motility protein PilT
MVALKASDLHLKAGNPPIFRIEGRLTRTKSHALTADNIEALVLDLVGQERIAKLRERGNLDVGHEFEGGRVRVAIYMQCGRLSLAARLVKTVIPTLEELHLPPQIAKVLEYGEGLVLVCGVTGCGKSTTLACLIQILNQREACNVLTFEDPIEYMFKDKLCIIHQRELGLDFHQWPDAISAGVRADPDVMLIGEMRDEDTFQLGLTAAQTGHLVFGTLHTSSAATTVSRILDLFPADRHKLIRQSLGFNLKAIICQRLVPSFKEEIGRVPAVELLFVNPPIRKVIEEGQDSRITDLILDGEKEGMLSWTKSFVDLVNGGYIDRKTAREFAPNRDALDMALKGISISTGTFAP